MLALLGHPTADPGGPTDMQWQEVLQKCSTQSYEDLRRIIAHGWANAGLDNPTVMVAKMVAKPLTIAVALTLSMLQSKFCWLFKFLLELAPV